jgi:hypothetical protein
VWTRAATLEEYLRPRLFEPLGLLPPLWSKSPAGKVYRFAENELGIRAASVSFAGTSLVIHFEDADGQHEITCGVGQWVRGTEHNLRWGETRRPRLVGKLAAR